jgi:hypothetical protein
MLPPWKPAKPDRSWSLDGNAIVPLPNALSTSRISASVAMNIEMKSSVARIISDASAS